MDTLPQKQNHPTVSSMDTLLDDFPSEKRLSLFFGCFFLGGLFDNFLFFLGWHIAHLLPSKRFK